MQYLTFRFHWGTSHGISSEATRFCGLVPWNIQRVHLFQFSRKWTSPCRYSCVIPSQTRFAREEEIRLLDSDRKIDDADQNFNDSLHDGNPIHFRLYALRTRIMLWHNWERPIFFIFFQTFKISEYFFYFWRKKYYENWFLVAMEYSGTQEW